MSNKDNFIYTSHADFGLSGLYDIDEFPEVPPAFLKLKINRIPFKTVRM